MELSVLQKHVRKLAILPETESLVLSCYLTLEQGRPKERKAVDQRIHSLRKTVAGRNQRDLEAVLEWIEAYLENELRPYSRGVAIFARAGEKRLFLPLQFRVPLPNWIVADSVPNLYHLIEMKDTYERYVVMISSENSIRIFGVNLGAVTEKLWRERSELRKRVGREWSKEHYQDHRKDTVRRFIREKIRILDRQVSAGGYTRLILAGNPAMTERVKAALPQHLREKLIDVVRVSTEAGTSDVVRATIGSFIEHEQRESHTVVEQFVKEIHSDGLAVIGTEACLQALQWGQVDTLLLNGGYKPELGWTCNDCGRMRVSKNEPVVCKECGASTLREFNIKEEMVRLAERNSSTIETVKESEILNELGGVGCLLRYRVS